MPSPGDFRDRCSSRRDAWARSGDFGRDCRGLSCSTSRSCSARATRFVSHWSNAAHCRDPGRQADEERLRPIRTPTADPLGSGGANKPTLPSGPSMAVGGLRPSPSYHSGTRVADSGAAAGIRNRDPGRVRRVHGRCYAHSAPLSPPGYAERLEPYPASRPGQSSKLRVRTQIGQLSKCD